MQYSTVRHAELGSLQYNEGYAVAYILLFVHPLSYDMNYYIQKKKITGAWKIQPTFLYLC